MAISASFFSNSNLSFHMASSGVPCTPGILNVQHEIMAKDTIFQVSQVKVRRKVNTTRVGATDRTKPHPSSRTLLLKPTMMLDQRIHSPKMVSKLGFGNMVDDFVLREKFNVRTYEIGPDRTLSLTTLMNYLQETSINHMAAIGALGDGLGNTPEMCKKHLIWVMAKMQVVVDHYPIWGDVIQIDTWKGASGKLGMSSDWVLSDCKTGEILVKASCLWLMMNKETRKLSKFPQEVRAELDQHFLDAPPVVKPDTRRWSKRDENIVDHVCNGLMPSRSDLDINQHVNNAKYVGWILESVPKTIEENYELASISLDYLRECRKDSVVESHTYVTRSNNGNGGDYDYVECEHMLQLEIGSSGGGEIMKGRTSWRPKQGK